MKEYFKFLKFVVAFLLLAGLPVLAVCYLFSQMSITVACISFPFIAAGFLSYISFLAELDFKYNWTEL